MGWKCTALRDLRVRSTTVGSSPLRPYLHMYSCRGGSGGVGVAPRMWELGEVVTRHRTLPHLLIISHLPIPAVNSETKLIARTFFCQKTHLPF